MTRCDDDVMKSESRWLNCDGGKNHKKIFYILLVARKKRISSLHERLTKNMITGLKESSKLDYIMKKKTTLKQMAVV